MKSTFNIFVLANVSKILKFQHAINLKNYWDTILLFELNPQNPICTTDSQFSWKYSVNIKYKNA
jgi:hypothetical protein